MLLNVVSFFLLFCEISNLYILPRKKTNPVIEADHTANQIETYPELHQLGDTEIPDEWHNLADEEEETSHFKAAATLRNFTQVRGPIDISTTQELQHLSLDENVHPVFSEDDDIFFIVNAAEHETSRQPNQITTEPLQNDTSIQLENPLSVENVSTESEVIAEPQTAYATIGDASVSEVTSTYNMRKTTETIVTSIKHESTNKIRKQKNNQDIPPLDYDQNYLLHVERPPTWDEGVPEKNLQNSIIHHSKEAFYPAHMAIKEVFPGHALDLTDELLESSGDLEASVDVGNSNTNSSGDGDYEVRSSGDRLATFEDTEYAGKLKGRHHTEGSADEDFLQYAEVPEHTERNIDCANPSLCERIASSGDHRSSYDHQGSQGQSSSGTDNKQYVEIFVGADVLGTAQKSFSVENSSKSANAPDSFDDAESSGDYSGSGHIEHPIIFVYTDHTESVDSPKNIEGSGNLKRFPHKYNGDVESSGETETSGDFQGSGDLENQEATITQSVSMDVSGRTNILNGHRLNPPDDDDLYFDSP